MAGLLSLVRQHIRSPTLPALTNTDGVSLFYEDKGSGDTILFIHEFAGNHRTWAKQVAVLKSDYRCIAYSARGYPPSDVPEDKQNYGQDKAVSDAVAVLDTLGIENAHIVGHSMGAYTALHVGIDHPDRCLSVAALGCGWGSHPDERETARGLCENIARMFREEPIADAAAKYARFHASYVRSKKSSGFRRIRKNSSRAFAGRRGANYAEPAARPPHPVGHGSGVEGVLAAAAGNGR